jgi:hypothetical protein
MNRRKIFFLKITSSMMMLTLMLPLSLQFLHIFESHQHKVCDDITTHLHKDAPDCDLCDFHFSPFDYTFTELPKLVAVQILYLPAKFTGPLLFNNLNDSTAQLRAPPAHS